MSGDNTTSGSSRFPSIPQSAYTDYAKTQEKLAETRQMAGKQGPDVVRRGAQLIQTAVTPSEFDRLWGTTQKGQPVKIDVPPGYDEQLAPLNVNGETLFGSPAHIISLQELVAQSPGDSASKTTVHDFLQVVIDDMSAKNGVLARRGSLQQG